MPGPWQTRQEFLVDEAMASASASPDEIRAIRPPIPQNAPKSNRGFSKQTPTIGDILNVNRYVASNRSWLSGTPVMNPPDTSENQGTEGGSRYSMGPLWT